MTRAYSGRLGRAVPTSYVEAWRAAEAPRPAPYPYQRHLVTRWRRGQPRGMDSVNHWAGQSAAMATERPAGEIVEGMWRNAAALLTLA